MASALVNPGGSPGQGAPVEILKKDKRGKSNGAETVEGQLTPTTGVDVQAAQPAVAVCGLEASHSQAFLAAIGQSMLQTLFANVLQQAQGGGSMAAPPATPTLVRTSSAASSAGAAGLGPMSPADVMVGSLQARLAASAGGGSPLAMAMVPSTTSPVRRVSNSPRPMAMDGGAGALPAADVAGLRDALAVKSYLHQQEESKRKELEAEVARLTRELSEAKEEGDKKVKKLKKEVKEKEEEVKQPILYLATCKPAVMPTALKGLTFSELRTIKVQYAAALSAVTKAKKDAKRREALAKAASSTAAGARSAWFKVWGRKTPLAGGSPGGTPTA